MQHPGMGKPRKKQHRKTFIRDWRKHRGLSLDRLASRIEMTPSNLSKIERGNQPYTQPVLEALADALSCEAADLIMRKPGAKHELEAVWVGLDEETKGQVTAIIQALKGRGKAA